MITELVTLLTSLDASKNGKTPKFNINLNRNHIRSISAYSSNSIFYFQTIVSDQVTPEEMGMVSRALEKSYASFVVTCISLMPFHRIRADDQASVEEYLSQFHQNLGIKAGNSNAAAKMMNLVSTIEESNTELSDIPAEDLEQTRDFLMECWEKSRSNCTEFIKIVQETVSLNDMYNKDPIDPVTRVMQEQYWNKMEELDTWGFIGEATADTLDDLFSEDDYDDEDFDEDDFVDEDEDIEDDYDDDMIFDETANSVVDMDQLLECGICSPLVADRIAINEDYFDDILERFAPFNVNNADSIADAMQKRYNIAPTPKSMGLMQKIADIDSNAFPTVAEKDIHYYVAEMGVPYTVVDGVTEEIMREKFGDEYYDGPADPDLSANVTPEPSSSYGTSNYSGSSTTSSGGSYSSSSSSSSSGPSPFGKDFDTGLTVVCAVGTGLIGFLFGRPIGRVFANIQARKDLKTLKDEVARLKAENRKFLVALTEAAGPDFSPLAKAAKGGAVGGIVGGLALGGVAGYHKQHKKNEAEIDDLQQQVLLLEIDNAKYRDMFKKQHKPLPAGVSPEPSMFGQKFAEDRDAKKLRNRFKKLINTIKTKFHKEPKVVAVTEAVSQKQVLKIAKSPALAPLRAFGKWGAKSPMGQFGIKAEQKHIRKKYHLDNKGRPLNDDAELDDELDDTDDVLDLDELSEDASFAAMMINASELE